MKQKYKVFINDQEIVFRFKKAGDSAGQTDFSSNQTALDIFKELSNDHKFPRTYVVESDQPENEFRKFINNFKLIEAAGGIVRKDHQKGDILVIFRLGKWDLPKGKIDKGESPENAAKREVEEECGTSGLEITNKVADTYHLYEHKGKIIVKKTYWFEMVTKDHNNPIPQTDEGITDARWVNSDELLRLLPQSYASISSLLREHILNR